MRRLIPVAVLAWILVVPVLADGCDTARPLHVLVANDDGVDAPGIAALATVMAADPAYRVTVVAPAEPQSGKSHALKIHGEIAVSPSEPVAGCPTWAVDATPATTVRLALSALLADDPPDLVLSGINRGENVGRIAWYSGTVAAAREAVLRGTPAVAFSLQLNWQDPQPDYAAAARWAKPIVDAVRSNGLPDGVYLNVNIPLDTSAIKGYRLTRQGLAPDQEADFVLDREENGVRYFNSRWNPPVDDLAGTDNLGLRDGWVVIAPLGLDATLYPALAELQTLQPVLPAPDAAEP